MFTQRVTFCFAFFFVFYMHSTPGFCASRASYAENIYRELLNTTNAEKISITTLNEGPLANLGDKSASDFLPVATHSIDWEVDQRMVTFSESSLRERDVYEQEVRVSDYNNQGLHASDGKYRTLLVAITINGRQRFHDSVEFCWVKNDYCVVIDNSLYGLDARVRSFVKSVEANRLKRSGSF